MKSELFSDFIRLLLAYQLQLEASLQTSRQSLVDFSIVQYKVVINGQTHKKSHEPYRWWYQSGSLSKCLEYKNEVV